MLSPQDAWDATLDQIALRTSRADFDTWLKGTELLAYADGEFTIKVQHAFAKDWLERHLLNDLNTTLTKTFKRVSNVTLVVHSTRHRATPSLSDAGPLFAALAEAAGEPADAGHSSNKTDPAAETTIDPAPANDAYMEWDPRYNDVRRTADLHKVPDDPDHIPLNPVFTFETFVTGPSNDFAYAAAQAVAENPGTRYNPLVIHGGVGLGKTHLLHAIGHQVSEAGRSVRYVTAEAFTNEVIAAIRARKTDELRQRYRSVDVLLVDDFQFMAGKPSTEEEFYHTFNVVVGRGGQVVIAASQPPRQIPGLDERLLSRLEGGLITDIQAPEQGTRQAILVIKATAQGMALPDDVARTLAQQAVQNVRELEGLLTQVLARAQLGRQSLTVALAEQVLKRSGVAHVQAPAKEPQINRILQAAAQHHQLSLDDLLSKRRTQKIARARQIAMYLAREETSASLPQIGEAFGGRNHSTVLYGYKKIAEAIKEDGGLRDDVDSIRQSIFSTD